MASLRALPALKAGTLEAAIFIFSPVWGFLPSLALRSRTENLPKPVILTSSPLLSASVTTSSKAPKYFWALPSGTPASSAILSMSSLLFMVAPFSGRPRLFCRSVGVAYSLFIREPEPLATPAFWAGLAKRTPWGCAVGHTPHLVPAPRERVLVDLYRQGNAGASKSEGLEPIAGRATCACSPRWGLYLSAKRGLAPF